MKTNDYLKEHSNIVNKCNFGTLDLIYEEIAKKIDSTSNIFTCGNGGSAYTSQHMVRIGLRCYTHIEKNKCLFFDFKYRNGDCLR